MLWATKAQEDIAKSLNPILLEFYQKKNLRSLSSEQYEELDTIKTKVLFTIDPYTKITSDLVKDSLTKINTTHINSSMSLYRKWQYDLQAKINSEMSIDDQKQAKAIFYSLVYRELGTTPEKQ